MWIKLILITIISSIVSGMGIGGGGIYILLATTFKIFEHKAAQGYNLIMFVVVGLFATIFNIKTKNFDKELFKKLFLLIIIGCIFGAIIAKILNENILRYIFYAFMIATSLYEIVVSIKNMIKEKTNN